MSELEKLLQGIGALAELARISFDSFKRQRFNDDQALALTQTVLGQMVKSASNKGVESDE